MPPPFVFGVALLQLGPSLLCVCGSVLMCVVLGPRVTLCCARRSYDRREREEPERRERERDDRYCSPTRVRTVVRSLACGTKLIRRWCICASAPITTRDDRRERDERPRGDDYDRPRDYDRSRD